MIEILEYTWVAFAIALGTIWLVIKGEDDDF